MAGQAVFYEDDDDSDTSSVNTDSTAPPDPQEEYSVEKILSEKLVDGERKFLVKWEGYPIAECTWEPIENFIEGNESLEEWAEQKRKIKRGLIKAFDIAKYYEARTKSEQKKARRVAKRREKRRQRAAAAATRRLVSRAERGAVLKKGTARRVTNTSARPSPAKSSGRKRKRPDLDLSSSSPSPSPSPARSVNDVQSSQWSLFNDPETNVAGADPSPRKSPKQPSSKRKRPNIAHHSSSSSTATRTSRPQIPSGAVAGTKTKDGASNDSLEKLRKPVKPVAPLEPANSSLSIKKVNKPALANPTGSSVAPLKVLNGSGAPPKTASSAAVPKATSSSVVPPKATNGSTIAPKVTINTVTTSKPTASPAVTSKIADKSTAAPKPASSATASSKVANVSAATPKAADSSTIPKKRPAPDSTSDPAAKITKRVDTNTEDVSTCPASDTLFIRDAGFSVPLKTTQSKVKENDARKTSSASLHDKPVPPKAPGVIETPLAWAHAASEPSETTAAAVTEASSLRALGGSTLATEKPAVQDVPAEGDTQMISEPSLIRTSSVSAPFSSTASKPPQTTHQDSATLSTPAASIPLRSGSGSAESKAAHTRIFNDALQKVRQRPRVNEYTPKDSTDPQFVNLSMQHRMQRYSVNEPPPDPDSLTFVDPKTGKPQDSAKNSSHQSSGLTVNTNVPRPDEDHIGNSTRRQSLDTQPAHRSESQSAQRSEPRRAYPSAGPPPHLDPQNMTCRFWIRNRKCKFFERCRYAHHMCEFVEPKRAAICKYWRGGNCEYPDDLCEFQHSYPPWPDGGYRIGGRGGETFYDRRSKSPERGRIRQDEAERKGRVIRSDTMTHANNPTSASPSVASMASPATTDAASNRNHGGNESNMHTASLPNPNTMPLTKQRASRGYEAQIAPATTCQQHDEDSFVPSEDPVPHVPDLLACLKISPSNSQTSTLNIRLVFDERASRTKLISAVGEEPLFEARDMCLARDFGKYWFQKDNIWTSGQVVFGQDDNVGDYVNDYLLLNNVGFVVRQETFIMLVYPAQAPGWDFFPSRGLEKPGARFHVQSAVPGTFESTLSSNITSKGTVTEDKNQFIAMCEQHLDLKEEVIFAGNNGKKLEKSVYMVFPSKDLPETRLIEAYFKEIGAKVHHSSDTGLWPGFLRASKQPDSVIVFHPAMFEYRRILGMHYVLHDRSDNIFQLGPDTTLRTRRDAATRFSCVRLFPSGQIFLVTDDVFKYHPSLALQVLDSFERKAKHSPRGGRNDRVCVRPGLLAWLGQLIDEDFEKGILTEDSDRIKVFEVAFKLSRLEANDTNLASRMIGSAPTVLYSPPRNEIPHYEGLWDSSEVDATDWLVQWFCEYCAMEREHFRRFTVLYEQHRRPVQTPGLNEFKDPREWMVKAQHVKVTNPARFLQQHKKRESFKSRV